MYIAEKFNIGKDNLATHQWYSEKNKENIFYFHGMQSHGGWCSELGTYLQNKGVNLFILDRRGSGRSDGNRGDISDKKLLLQDYKQVIDHLFESKIKNKYCWLLGQSLGASILTSYLSSFAHNRYKGIILVAPALGQVRVKNSGEDIDSWSNKDSDAYIPINLPTEFYTQNQKYINFIEKDPLAIKQITFSTKKTMLDLDDSYINSEITNMNYRAYLMIPKEDKINFIEKSENVAKKFYGKNNVKKYIFNTEDHYLEYSSAKDDYFSTLLSIVTGGGENV
ncbi:MAG: alpha/beta fold hydrolase [Alphaproteobacteria bacterium]|jgi:pimeloyl-ACP methyl ester carboxylesterase|nr:alpha/beta fold hydrolase [Alphaproteobacteria bacterium]